MAIALLFLMWGTTFCLSLPAEQPPVPRSSPVSSPMTVANPVAADRESAQKGTFPPRNARYQIRPADVIDIIFYPAAELNQTLSVQPDGFVTLREAGDLYVEGKTVPELKHAIMLAYRGILHDPVITIVLKDFDKPHFIVGGQVAKPGKYELRADTTVSEAIAIAGGINEKAKHTQVVLFRRISDDWAETKSLDLKAIYRGKLNEDIHLRPGDMLFVPQNKFSKFKPFIPMWSIGTYMNPATF